MSVLNSLIDVITLKSEKPMRRLLAYYGILAIIVLAIALLAPSALNKVVAKGLAEVSEGPTVLQDALAGNGSGASALPLRGLADLSITTLLIMIGTLALMLPVTWVYMSARPVPGHSQTIVQTLIFLPIVVAGIVYLVQNSLALAFSLAGVMAAVRFRVSLKDTRDVVYIFLAIVVGFSAGVQSLAVGALVSIFFNLVILITWRYDYGRNVLTPTAASQWAGPLHTLASPTGNHEIPDRDLILSLTPDKADVLADRFGRVSKALGKKQKKPRFDSVLSITTYNVPEAQGSVEKVLDHLTKRWELDEIVTNTGKPSGIYYIVRLKKSVPRDELLTAIHQTADGIIDTVDLETRGPAQETSGQSK
ncbi:MAG TPA: DUF4956 domain-containing protein [Gemmatimonadaceae bacterium]|nr:DUF4956 domain-containing protein [Gemmatimonadaceae bacterium]